MPEGEPHAPLFYERGYVRARDLLASIDARCAQHGRVLLALEVVLAAVMVWPASRFLYRMMRAMARSSLWIDELFSVKLFSSQGPWHTMSDYRIANNHIFFNLLASLSPYHGSFQPLQARFWSFVAVAATLLVVAWHFARRRRYFEAALGFSFFAIDELYLNSLLQARGYGLLCIAAVLVCVATERYLETRSVRFLWLLGAASVLGTYTVPTFVVFAGIVLLVLWATARSRHVLYTGMAVGATIAGLYSLVFTQLMSEMQGYEANWGLGYAKLEAVSETFFSNFWPDFPAWATLALLAFIVWAPYQLPSTSGARAWRVLGGSAVVAFCVFLAMRTPQVRTVAFLLVPVALVTLSVASEALRHAHVLLRVPAMMLVAWLMFGVATQRREEFQFVPMEAWLEVARYIHKHFPPGTPVYAPFRTELLDMYLDDTYPFVAQLDEDAFARGDVVWVDSNFQTRDRLDPKRYSSRAQTVEIPQRRGDRQIIGFVKKP